MTEQKKYSYLRSMTETQLDDEMLQFYLDSTADVILARAYPFAAQTDRARLPERFHRLQCEISAYLINRRGAEGETSHSENGISRVYESAAIPESMLRQIVPCCGVPS